MQHHIGKWTALFKVCGKYFRGRGPQTPTYSQTEPFTVYRMLRSPRRIVRRTRPNAKIPEVRCNIFSSMTSKYSTSNHYRLVTRATVPPCHHYVTSKSDSASAHQSLRNPTALSKSDSVTNHFEIRQRHLSLRNPTASPITSNPTAIQPPDSTRLPALRTTKTTAEV